MILVVKHIAIEGPGLIADFFERTNWKIKIVELGQGERLPKSLSRVEAAIILGGPMNVYRVSQFPFLKQEDVLLKQALKDNIPILGICLGAQLLAKACGARVHKAEEGELGWLPVKLTEQGEQDALFVGTGKELKVFQWHEDTFELPRQAVWLAKSQSCRHQAFRVKKNAYGLQFHIEVTPDMCESWIKTYLNNGARIQAQNMIIDAYKQKEYLRQLAGRILLNFSRLIARNN